MNLNRLGWNEKFEEAFNEINKDGNIQGRVSREEKGRYTVRHADGECTAVVSGKLRYKALSISDFPAVGDWVAMKLINNGEEGVIFNLLPRKSSFTRKAPISGARKVKDYKDRTIVLGGTTEEQVIAANVDVIFIVMALDCNFNLRRLERYLLLAWNSGATPVIVLNKIDMCDDVEQRYIEVCDIAQGVNIHCISALEDNGIDQLQKYINEGVTIGLFGSSGVGKSTIINCLLGKVELLTGAIRDNDSKGRHTTTWREMVVMPSGGILIDTPGMRELQLWSEMEELEDMFEDIKEFEFQCKFNDCSHNKEPGCAINKALQDGTLDKDRYENYLLMRHEISYVDYRKDERTKYLSSKGKLKAKIISKRKGKA